MDSYQALRKDLETFAKELNVKNFQALSPGLGLGVLAQKENLRNRVEVEGSHQSISFPAVNVQSSLKSVSPLSPSEHSQPSMADSFSHSLGNQKADQKQAYLSSRGAPTGIEEANEDRSNGRVIPLQGLHHGGEDRRGVGQSTRSAMQQNHKPNQREYSRLGRPSDTFIARPMNLGVEAPLDKKVSTTAPWWVWVLGHVVDLLAVCLCLAVCAYGVSLMLADFRSIKFLKITPAVWISLIYGTLIFYTLVFKLLGIPLMGALIRRSLSSRKQSDEKLTSSI